MKPTGERGWKFLLESTGRELYVCCRTIGLDGDGVIYNGHDGYLGETEGGLTDEEKAEVADHMIAEWTKLRSSLDTPMPATTNQALNSPRGRVADTECTRDPIFLFQHRRWVCSPDIDWEDHGLRLDDEGRVYDEDGNEVSDEELANREIMVETWVTERVFGTREECNAYGERRSYNYPSGWRSYSVPCDGKLAALLVQHWE